MPTPYTKLPCGTILKTSGITKMIPLGQDQDDINRRTTKPTVLLHHGSTKLRVEFKNAKDRDGWITDMLSTLNSPSKPAA